MTRMIIVVGDTTTGGGTVITGSAFTDIDGKPVARIGDQATCCRCKGTFPIVSGDATFIIDGQPVARERDWLACGCRLISIRQFRVFLDEGTSDAPEVDAAMRQRHVAGASDVSDAASPADTGYDEAFVLKSEVTGKPLANRRYRIIRETGAVEEGVTDAHGMTHVLTADHAESLKIELAEEEPA